MYTKKRKTMKENRSFRSVMLAVAILILQHGWAQVLDAVGCLLWQGRIANDRWVLDVGSWARGAYVLRMAHRGRMETHVFVLIE